MNTLKRRVKGKRDLLQIKDRMPKNRAAKLVVPKFRTVDEQRHLMAKSLLWRLEVAKHGKIRSAIPTISQLNVALVRIDTYMLIQGWDNEQGTYTELQLDCCFDVIEQDLKKSPNS